MSHAGAPVHAHHRSQCSSRSCAAPRPALLVSARGAERPHTPCFMRFGPCGGDGSGPPPPTGGGRGRGGRGRRRPPRCRPACAEELSDSVRSLVTPVEAELETEDHAEHTLMQQRYEQAVTIVHNYSLVLAKFAQFLLVQNDHDWAGHCFERAVQAESADSEALSWYDLAGIETVLVKLDSDDED